MRKKEVADSGITLYTVGYKAKYTVINASHADKVADLKAVIAGHLHFYHKDIFDTNHSFQPKKSCFFLHN